MSHYYKLLDWIDINKLSWYCLSGNPGAIHLIEQNLDKIDWIMLSANPNAIHLLEKNPDKINWDWLSRNQNAIHLLEQNPDKIYWDYLSLNPSAIHLLEQNIDKINWIYLSKNPAIFTYDYEKIKTRMEEFGIKDELLAYYYRPENAHKFIERGDVSFDFVKRWK